MSLGVEVISVSAAYWWGRRELTGSYTRVYLARGEGYTVPAGAGWYGLRSGGPPMTRD